ncbi:MAG: TetR/AcrR family transcriptional regulator [Gammaproteobacteria bacterium]
MSKEVSGKNRIIEAARTLFLDKGFNGTSISEIAKRAEVAKSSIFHHFPTKEELWRVVKATYVDQVSESQKACSSQPASVRSFIEFIVEQRFEIYAERPDLTRLIMWQQLEKDQEKLYGIQDFIPDDWSKQIDHLQKKGLMISEYSDELITILIYGSISNIFFDQRREVFKDKNKLEQYKKLLINGLEKALSKPDRP